MADPSKTASADVQLLPLVALTVSPAAAAVAPARQQQFTALVHNNSNTAVTWTLTPAGVGTITPNGLYTAPSTLPAQQTVTVTATSVANPAESASATVTLTAASVALALTPLAGTLSAGQTAQFTATVANTANTAVNWSQDPNVGTISTTGLYAAPASVTAQQATTVFAVSQADPTKMASATVTLLPTQTGALQLAPNFGRQGRFLRVAITGLNTHFAQGVTKARFGPGVQVGGGIGGDFGPVTVTSPTTAVAQVSIIRKTSIAPRSITVQTDTETVSLDNGFNGIRQANPTLDNHDGCG